MNLECSIADIAADEAARRLLRSSRIIAGTPCPWCGAPAHAAMCDEATAELHDGAARIVAANSALAELTRLREALAELLDLGEWTWSESDECSLFTIHITEQHHDELTAIAAARKALA